ncbi:hypothetical protein BRD56_00765 [Thermoplasmatales archaeon SW_10_69_26]|nr:MAG: hypothetical protein BRD56_00765 [Thermoplasmatales archaeon SW_10_69_26]
MTSQPPGVNAVLQAVDRRGDTDERPSFFTHVVLPILLALAGAGAGAGLVLATTGYRGTIEATIASASPSVLGAAVILTAGAALVGAILFVVGFYKVMRRRESHFARDRVLREGLIDYADRLARSASGTRAREHVEAMRRIHTDARIDERAHPAAVDLVLVAVFPLWYLYILFSLTKDLPDHARRQARFLREVHNVVDDAGLEVPEVEAVPSVNERSYLLVLVLALVVPFGNLIVLYWLYNDPEEHFDQQWRHEDALVELVSEHDEPAPETAPEETEAPDSPDVDPGGPTHEEADEAEPPNDVEAEADEASQEAEPEFTVWACPECESRYKVPPKRPVRVTCKECEHQEVLEE